MATRKRLLVPVADSYPDPDHEDFELFDFMEEVGPQIARIYVYRLPKQGNPEYLGTVPIEQLRAAGAEEWLWETHKAGTYSIKFRGSDGKWKLQKTFTIGDRTAGAPAAAPGGSRSEELEKELALMRQREHEVLLALIARPQAGGSGDPAAMLTAVVGAFTTLRTPPPAADIDGGPDWIGKVRDIFDLARDIGRGGSAPPPGEDDGAGWLGVVRDVGVKVAEAFVTAKSGGAPAAPAPLAIAAQIGADTMTEHLRAAIQYLKIKATLAKPPENYVAQIIDNEDEPQCKALISAIEQGATFDHLLAFDPEIATNPALSAWFKVLYDGLFQAIFSQPVDTGRPDGDADHPAINAGSGAPGPESPASKKTGRGSRKPAGD